MKEVAGKNNKDLDQWNLEQENSRPADSMSKGSEAEVTRLQVENQGMVQFDHIRRDTEGDMRMEMRTEVWGGKA